MYSEEATGQASGACLMLIYAYDCCTISVQSEGVVPEAYVSPYEVPPSQKASDAPLPTTVTF